MPLSLLQGLEYSLVSGMRTNRGLDKRGWGLDGLGMRMELLKYQIMWKQGLGELVWILYLAKACKFCCLYVVIKSVRCN